MLDLSKKILEKVSFDASLFRKELGKAIRWLQPHEALVLKAWCVATFGHIYQEIIQESFEGSFA